MKIAEIQNLSREELLEKHGTLKRELFNLRMQVAVGKLEKPHRLRLMRREIAQILTVLHGAATARENRPPPAKD